MARRERERYTERSRPYRREPGQSGGGSGNDSGTSRGSSGESNPLSNPVVLVALGALALAGVLALGVFLGRRPADTTTAGTTPAATTPGAETTPAITDTLATNALPTGGPQPTSAVDTSGLSLPESGTPYAAPEDMKLDPAQAYFSTIKTSKGDIVVELWPALAPKHVNSFAFLAGKDFFDKLTFHRVEPGFVIQGGDPNGDGSGGPGYAIPGEFNTDNPVPHRVGTLAMARTQDPNSAGSQFYIVTADGAGATSLDGQYTVFGHVVKGMDVVQQIAVGDEMTDVSFETKPAAESLVSPDDIRAGKLPENN